MDATFSIAINVSVSLSELWSHLGEVCISGMSGLYASSMFF